MPFIGNKPSAVPLTSADITDGIITSAKIADGTIVNADISSTSAITLNKLSGNPNFRNRIINGDMRIAQRGTSFSYSTGPGGYYYGADRFRSIDYTFSSGTNPTVSNDTSVYPTGFTNSYKYQTGATGLTFASGGIQTIEQNIEGFNIVDCYTKNITISFWVRASTAGQYNIMLNNGTSSSFGRYITKNYTINSANTWEQKTITVDLSAGTSSGTWNTTNGSGLALIFVLGAHSNRTGNEALDTWTAPTNYNFLTTGSVNLATIANSTFYLTGVQLEAGTSATDFEFLPIDVNLQRCERYYQLLQGMNGSGETSTSVTQSLSYKTQTRATPTISQLGVITISENGADRTQSSINITTNNSSDKGALVTVRNYTSITQYRPYFWNSSSSTACITLDAEL